MTVGFANAAKRSLEGFWSPFLARTPRSHAECALTDHLLHQVVMYCMPSYKFPRFKDSLWTQLPLVAYPTREYSPAGILGICQAAHMAGEQLLPGNPAAQAPPAEGTFTKLQATMGKRLSPDEYCQQMNINLASQ